MHPFREDHRPCNVRKANNMSCKPFRNCRWLEDWTKTKTPTVTLPTVTLNSTLPPATSPLPLFPRGECTPSLSLRRYPSTSLLVIVQVHTHEFLVMWLISPPPQRNAPPPLQSVILRCTRQRQRQPNNLLSSAASTCDTFFVTHANRESRGAQHSEIGTIKAESTHAWYHAMRHAWRGARRD